MTTPDNRPLTLTLSRDAIQRLAPLAGTDAARPSLHGIILEADGTAAATDGHVLGAWRNALPNADERPTAEPVMLDAKALLSATRKLPKREPLASLFRTSLPDGKVAYMTSTGGIVPVLDMYMCPPWRSALNQVTRTPKTPEGSSAHGITIDPAVLGKFGSGPVKLAYVTGNPSASVTRELEPDFWGLVMLCRREPDAPPSVPDWLPA